MKIEFLSYDGKYPNLCRGQLILRIDGKIYAFGIPNQCFDFITYKKEHKDVYESFWISGGSAGVDWNGDAFCDDGAWEFNKDELPDFLKPHAQEIFYLFQSNVPSGCCGGCI